MITFEQFRDHLGNNLKPLGNGLRLATPESTFKDLGFDSLHVVEATMVAEALFGVTIPDHDLDDCTTLGDLYGRAAEHLQAMIR